MIFPNPFRSPNHGLTCKDFDYTGIICCDICHAEERSVSELRVVQIDGQQALLCCLLVKFFYPANPDTGLSPEEKLLRAIFGEKAYHEPDEGD